MKFYYLPPRIFDPCCMPALYVKWIFLTFCGLSWTSTYPQLPHRMIDPLDPRSYPRRFFNPINHEINFNPLNPSFIFSYLKESFFIAMDPSQRYYIAKFYFFQLFKGIFFYCDGPQLQRLQIKNKDDCLTHSGSGHKWVNHKYNFDNLGKDIYPKYYKNSNK